MAPSWLRHACHTAQRVVLVADRGLLRLNNLRDLDVLRAELSADGRGVSLAYVLAVPAARYGEFRDELQALHETQDSSQPWAAEMTWKHSPKADEQEKASRASTPCCSATAPPTMWAARRP